MTTTSIMSGLGSDEKSSSRVLRPPGGESSDIFGTTSTTPQQRQNANNRGASNIFGIGDETSSPQTPGSAKHCTHSNIFGAEDHKIYGKGRNQSRGKFNPITGAPYNDDGSPSAATSDPAEPPQVQQSDSPSVGASAQASPQTGQGDGSLQAAPGKAQPEVHTSSRVLHPPGGHTHKLW